YLSIVSLREVETSNLCRRLHDAGKRLCVPVLIDGHIVPARYRPGDPLASGMFGQPEPTRISLIDPQELEAVIVPLVGIDAHGYRMGYGKGFYDRFLAGLVDSGYSPCRIGLGFRMQFVSDLPSDPWDEPLDYAVHEGGIVQFT
ncbi:MAG: 5-formyltetrahydrofolate cyclo-ligase, partial [Deltaproteobacteria bacterium]|nr:5-formyltetrahydrofolate cyclo-ligase [Deltaproteobacteria bacterium]